MRINKFANKLKMYHRQFVILMMLHSLKMATIYRFPVSTLQISVTFFIFHSIFNLICSRLHGLVRTCMSDALDFNVAFAYNKVKVYHFVNLLFFPFLTSQFTNVQVRR